MEFFVGLVSIVMIVFWFVQYSNILATRKSNDRIATLLREQNDLLRKIADK